MIERLTDFDGYLIRFTADRPSPRAVLFLHGFPAHRGVKNLDLADTTFREIGDTAYVLHFRGLGESRGTFGFQDSIREATDVIDRLVSRYGHERVAVVGHSFGGMVALNAAAARPDRTDRVLLLSPLCHMEEGDSLFRWLLDEAPNEWPGVYGSQTREALLADIQAMGRSHLPSVIAPDFPDGIKLGLIQSATDTVTPAVRARELLGRFRRKPEYLELALDHSFTENRQLLARHVVDFLRSPA